MASSCSTDGITALLQKPGAVAVANKPSRFIRWGLISGVAKIEFPHRIAKNREFPNEGEVGLASISLLHFYCTPS
jgi:hypothetical protein